jgi:ribosomal protein S18 acetylase RimI-like enzyme
VSYNISFRELSSGASREDLANLTGLARQTFGTTFTHYSQSDLNAYLDKALSLEALRSELEDASNRFVTVHLNGELTGYLKWQYPTTRYQEHARLPAKRPFLLERFYFLEAYQGRGIAPIALAYCLSFAKCQAGSDYIYLSVWEGNYRAQRFYQKHGFRTLGSFDYPVGSQLDREFLYGMPL